MRRELFFIRVDEIQRETGTKIISRTRVSDILVIWTQVPVIFFVTLYYNSKELAVHYLKKIARITAMMSMTHDTRKKKEYENIDYGLLKL